MVCQGYNPSNYLKQMAEMQQLHGLGNYTDLPFSGWLMGNLDNYAFTSTQVEPKQTRKELQRFIKGCAMQGLIKK